jgi:hypothetical protein
MSILIGYALGVSDVSQLGNFALITAAMQACGFIVEASLRNKQQLTTFGGPIFNKQIILGATVAGWLLFVSLWGPLLYTFWSRVNDVSIEYKGLTDSTSGKPIKVPAFVWFIVLVQLYNYASFGIIQAKQIAAAFKNKLPDFKTIESKYLKLSFAGKLGLASGLGYGLIYRTKDCNDA